MALSVTLKRVGSVSLRYLFKAMTALLYFCLYYGVDFIVLLDSMVDSYAENISPRGASKSSRVHVFVITVNQIVRLGSGGWMHLGVAVTSRLSGKKGLFRLLSPILSLVDWTFVGVACEYFASLLIGWKVVLVGHQGFNTAVAVPTGWVTIYRQQLAMTVEGALFWIFNAFFASSANIVPALETTAIVYLLTFVTHVMALKCARILIMKVSKKIFVSLFVWYGMAMDRLNRDSFYENQERILKTARVSYARSRKLLQCYKNNAKTNKMLVKGLLKDLTGLDKSLEETDY
jgi:hypothetical protein